VLVVTTAISVGGIHATLHVTELLAVVLLILDLVGWRVIPPMFDRERLIIGTRA
jgi:hypothetical protein